MNNIINDIEASASYNTKSQLCMNKQHHFYSVIIINEGIYTQAVHRFAN